jgi:hypothetical protein
MPYKVSKNDEKYCVEKEDGERVGCHETRQEAINHLAALYSSVNDADKEKSETSHEKNMVATEASGGYYFGVTSFSELERLEGEHEISLAMSELVSRFNMLSNNIIDSYEIYDKSSALKALVDEYTERVDALSARMKEKKSIIQRAKEAVVSVLAPKDDPEDEGMMIWKEDGGETYYWFARYSNNFRDDDLPAEIISSDSHRKFIEKVDEGIAPLPELWLWHVPEWKIGQAQWVSYDDSGFALAYGSFDKGKEAVAEWLMRRKGVRVSHGMPLGSIVRDENDPTVIVEHETREISPLPYWAAANKLTGFITIPSDNDNKEDEMPIPQRKKQALIEQWGVNPELLDRLEVMNQEVASKAISEGIESKEATLEIETENGETVAVEVVIDNPEAEEVAQVEEVTEVEQVAVAEETATDEKNIAVSETSRDYPSRQEVAEAFASVMTPFVEQMSAMTEKIEALSKELTELKKSDEEKIVKSAGDVPAASLSAMIAKSVIGRSETRVKENDKLVSSKPKEADKSATQKTGIPLIDSFLGE